MPESRLRRSGDWTIIEGLEVPAVRGVDGCGSQALATALAHLDPSLDPVALGEALPWHDEGATPVDLLLEARDRGFSAEISRGDWDLLAEDVTRGERVSLVMFDTGPEVPTLTARIPTSAVLHWGVVSGLAKDGSALLLAAESSAHHVVEREEFTRRWSATSYCRITIGR